jgi:hypothetical protein
MELKTKPELMHLCSHLNGEPKQPKQSLNSQDSLERLNAMAISQLQVLIKSKQIGQLENK